VKKLNISVRFILFVVLAVVTLAAPLSIIWKYENTLRHGTLYKFRTEPVDPYDAFRGRYVTLSFADTWLKDSKDERFVNEGILYVRLKRDAEGFAVPVEASNKRLSGDDVVTVGAAYRNWRRADDGWRFDYPFNRYYLPEDVAPMAEKLYGDANRRATAPNIIIDESIAEIKARRARQISASYVAVRVRNGVGVIEELYLNGVPVREAVRAEMLRQQKLREQQGVNDSQ